MTVKLEEHGLGPEGSQDFVLEEHQRLVLPSFGGSSSKSWGEDALALGKGESLVL